MRLTSHHMPCETSLDDHLGIIRSQFAMALPADFTKGEEQDFDRTEVLLFFKKSNYKVCMCVAISSNILPLSVSVWNTGTGSNQICTYFCAVKWQDRIRSIHNMSFRSVCDSNVQVRGKQMLSAQLRNLHVGFYFGTVDNHAMLILDRRPFFDKLVPGIFPSERRIVTRQSCQIVIISE